MYAHNSEEAKSRIPRVQRGFFPSSLKVWLEILYFFEKGVKTKAVDPRKPSGTFLSCHVSQHENLYFSKFIMVY